jgi:hypothetical protein
VNHRANSLLRLVPAIVLPVVLLLAASGCSNTNLGDIDESVDSREEMPGPGIFAQDDGKPALTWSSDSDEPTAVAEQPASTSPTTTTAAAATTAAATTAAADKAEFEQFKAWDELRTKGVDSAEYQEFQQWLEYRKFKAAE